MKPESKLVALLILPVCAGSFWLGRLGTHRDKTALAIASESPGGSAAGAREDESPFSEPSFDHLRELIAAPLSPRRLLEFRTAMRNLDATELRTLWAFALTEFDFAHRDDWQMAMALLARLAQLDPAAALALAEQAGRWKNEMLAEVAAAWALIDLEPALEFIATADANLRKRAMRTALELIGDTDREAALALFKRGIDEGLIAADDWLAHDFLREWMNEDPPRAMTAAMEMHALTKREDIVALALATMAVKDPDAAKAWLKNESGDLSAAIRKRLIVALVDGWAERTPREAADYVLTLTDPEIADAAAAAVFDDWTAQSFADAAAWVNSLGEPLQRYRMDYKMMMAAVDHGDRDAAFAYGMSKFPDNRHLNHALYMHASSIVGEDPQRAVAWVKETFAHNPLLQEEVYNTLLHQMRWNDPAESSKHLHLMPDPDRRADDYEFHVSQWAERDVDAAREWANALPESIDRDRALIGVAQIWIKEEPAAAAAWIETLEQGELRDRVTSHHIRQLHKDDIPAALEMAEALDDPFRRDDSLEFVMGEWLTRDHEAARAAIVAHEGLSETAKWRLLEGGDYHHE